MSEHNYDFGGFSSTRPAKPKQSVAEKPAVVQVPKRKTFVNVAPTSPIERPAAQAAPKAAVKERLNSGLNTDEAKYRLHKVGRAATWPIRKVWGLATRYPSLTAFAVIGTLAVMYGMEMGKKHEESKDLAANAPVLQSDMINGINMNVLRSAERGVISGLTENGDIDTLTPKDGTRRDYSTFETGKYAGTSGPNIGNTWTDNEVGNLRKGSYRDPATAHQDNRANKVKVNMQTRGEPNASNLGKAKKPVAPKSRYDARPAGKIGGARVMKSSVNSGRDA